MRKVATLPLFDRLTDDNPFENRDTSFGTNLSVEQLKESIVRDLTLLLNTRFSPLLKKYADEYGFYLPFAYGANLTAPKYAETVFELQNIEKSIVTAISQFEPRLKNIRVTIEPNPQDTSKAIANITADIKISDVRTTLTFPILMDTQQ